MFSGNHLPYRIKFVYIRIEIVWKLATKVPEFGTACSCSSSRWCCRWSWFSRLSFFSIPTRRSSYTLKSLFTCWSISSLTIYCNNETVYSIIITCSTASLLLEVLLQFLWTGSSGNLQLNQEHELIHKRCVLRQWQLARHKLFTLEIICYMMYFIDNYC